MKHLPHHTTMHVPVHCSTVCHWGGCSRYWQFWYSSHSKLPFI